MDVFNAATLSSKTHALRIPYRLQGDMGFIWRRAKHQIDKQINV
jgi:hypothetical protein